jgi:hypothetical protein
MRALLKLPWRSIVSSWRGLEGVVNETNGLGRSSVTDTRQSWAFKLPRYLLLGVIAICQKSLVGKSGAISHQLDHQNLYFGVRRSLGELAMSAPCLESLTASRGPRHRHFDQRKVCRTAWMNSTVMSHAALWPRPLGSTGHTECSRPRSRSHFV